MSLRESSFSLKMWSPSVGWSGAPKSVCSLGEIRSFFHFNRLDVINHLNKRQSTPAADRQNSGLGGVGATIVGLGNNCITVASRKD